MTYLLAKYTLLFLAASILGFVLGYWWSRRRFVDVSESYADLRKATTRTDSANWDRLWTRLDALPKPVQTDLSPVVQRLEAVQGAVAAIPKPDAVDLAPVEGELASLTKRVAGIPVPMAPKPIDLTPVATRLDTLEQEIRAIPKPAAVDLQPVRGELATIREQIRVLPKVETHDPVDLAPVAQRIDALDQRVSRIPQPEKVDLRPVETRLQSIEANIAKLDQRLVRPVARKMAEPKPRKEGPTILSAALYGKKDDLKLISGVGPKLEKLLNKNGVYYFWQVASWSRSDIRTVDERLDAFKGRIARDNWVMQARKLKQAPNAAEMPAD